MEPLALKLEMLKGPREGETLEYRPGSKVRIGRVVRGNNLPIKDSGISTNHLIIDSSESGQWLIRDLGSSNGTIVNDTKLDPNKPSELHDGDEIKIGEYTSISVKIYGDDESKLRRRNPRRGAVGRRGRDAEESEVRVEVEKDEVIGGAAAIGRRCRVAKRKNEVEGEEIEVVEKPKRVRGRPPRKGRVLKSEELVEGVAVVPEVSSRGNERSKTVVSDSENCNVECEQVKIEAKRRGRGRKKKNVEEEPVVCEIGNVAAEKDLGEVGVSGDNDNTGEVPAQKELGEIGLVDLKDNAVDKDDGKGLNLEDERHEEAVVDAVDEEIGPVGVDGDIGEVPAQKELGAIGPVDLKDLAVDEDDGKGSGFDVGKSRNDNEKAKGCSLGHEEEAIDCNVGESGVEVESGSRSCSGTSGAKDVDQNGTGSGVEEGLGKVWQEPDLEKMTLDDWFDYVEVSWPKVVNDEIDKICAGIREKAKLVQEYIEQHKKEKGQS